MERYDITDQVLARLSYYAERIRDLESQGLIDEALVLCESAQLMAEYADSQEEWLMVSVND